MILASGVVFNTPPLRACRSGGSCPFGSFLLRGSLRHRGDVSEENLEPGPLFSVRFRFILLCGQVPPLRPLVSNLLFRQNYPSVRVRLLKKTQSDSNKCRSLGFVGFPLDLAAADILVLAPSL